MNKNKAMCCGCYNEQYHHGLGGSMECWCYADSKIENRIPISVDIPPPYRKKDAKKMLSCYRRSKMVYVSPDALTSAGFWKRF